MKAATKRHERAFEADPIEADEVAVEASGARAPFVPSPMFLRLAENLGREIGAGIGALDVAIDRALVDLAFLDQDVEPATADELVDVLVASVPLPSGTPLHAGAVALLSSIAGVLAERRRRNYLANIRLRAEAEERAEAARVEAERLEDERARAARSEWERNDIASKAAEDAKWSAYEQQLDNYREWRMRRLAAASPSS